MSRVSMTRLALVLLAMLLATTVHAVDDIEVVEPASLRKKWKGGRITDRPAMFGNPSYGSKIVGPVVYATKAATDDGCQPITIPQSMRATGASIIVMVDRGDCDFVAKARNAESAGAAALIVIDSHEYDHDVAMWDDHTGRNVIIPSVLINKDDGKLITDALANHGDVVIMSMGWSVPVKTSTVKWKFFTASDDMASREFKDEFGKAVELMGEKADLEVHYVHHTWGSGKDCLLGAGRAGVNPKRYCATDPDGDGDAGHSGEDIIKENLRQMCVWDAAKKAGKPWSWWVYVSEFNRKCLPSSSAPMWPEWTSKCVSEALAWAGMKETDINMCITQTWSADGTENTRMEAELKEQAKAHVAALPWMSVNDEAYHGTVDCGRPIDVRRCGLLGEICDGFQAGMAPAVCDTEPGCDLGQRRDACDVCGGLAIKCELGQIKHVKDSLKPGYIVFIVLMVLGVIGASVLFYLRRQQGKILDDVDMLLQQYLPMDHANAIAGAKNKPAAGAGAASGASGASEAAAAAAVKPAVPAGSGASDVGGGGAGPYV